MVALDSQTAVYGALTARTPSWFELLAGPTPFAAALAEFGVKSRLRGVWCAPAG